MVDKPTGFVNCFEAVPFDIGSALIPTIPTNS